ncbi:MAG: ABC transporter permease [Halofilum sp. (in: g-proteobacteria)]|nr:ABC transporter permease [Halofilum sp. (in: g-proteobacteria)]
MRALFAVFRRELGSYFVTPLAYVFLVIFLALIGALTFYFGGFYQQGQADLGAFFGLHPWLYAFLVPALAMRLWAEERETGTIELLLTLPLTTTQAVLGKFLAAWVFIGLALALTAPMWWTVAYLGNPDHGVIVASYLGSLLMAGGFLAIGSFVSALTRSQVIAFVMGFVLCFVLLMAGYPLVLDAFQGWAPEVLADGVAAMSFLTHFESIRRGVVELRDLVYFAGLIAFFLYANVLVIEMKKGD